MHASLRASSPEPRTQAGARVKEFGKQSALTEFSACLQERNSLSNSDSHARPLAAIGDSLPAFPAGDSEHLMVRRISQDV
jgi:hypothetical protein